MANVKAQIIEVANILTAMKDLELANLSAISRKKQEKTAQISDLQRLRAASHSNNQTIAPISTLQLVGGDLHWNEWVTRRIASLNVDLAGLAADFEEQKIKAQRALGHDMAIQKISNRT